MYVMRPHKKGQQALHFYSAANFVTSWLQMILNVSNELLLESFEISQSSI